MKTDKLFYSFFRRYPQLFFELIGEEPTKASRYTFKSIEVKELSFRIDGLFVPKRTGDVLYIVEVQFQRDEHFYPRVFAETFLYLRQYAPAQEWKAVAVFPNREAEPKNQAPYRELLESRRVRRIYLNELKSSGTETGLNILKLVVEPEHSAPRLARELVLRTKDNASLLELIEQILVQKFQRLTREEIRKMLDIDVELFKDTQVFKEVMQEGREKGREEGREEERWKVAKRLLAERLPIELIVKTTGLSKTQLRQVSAKPKPALKKK